MERARSPSPRSRQAANCEAPLPCPPLSARWFVLLTEKARSPSPRSRQAANCGAPLPYPPLSARWLGGAFFAWEGRVVDRVWGWALLRRSVPVDSNQQLAITISTEPWGDVDVDAFVCPTNSEGRMSHYPASKVRDLAGKQVEAQVRAHTPLAVGAALVTPGGGMRARHIIHVPDTEKPGGRVQVEDVLRATAAVIVAADTKGFSSLAIPLMGAFERGIPAEEAARAIHSELRSYRGGRALSIFLMAKDADEVEVFELAIEGNG